ncbi:MAG: hypothetical protein H6673_04785 [Anaerolineales bacterium]|nr:hypothetical protein [Anaerolineales bacterium]
MRFLVKIILTLGIISGGSLGLVVGQRIIRPTDLEHTLAIRDECGLNCWFHIPLDGTTNRRDVQHYLDDIGATYTGINRPQINFWVKQGSGEIVLEEGIAVSSCFFPRATTLGDTLATFGEPDGLWLEYQGIRYSARYSGQVYLRYEMFYQTKAVRLAGYIRLDTNLQRPRLSPITAVDELCTPLPIRDDEFMGTRVWTEWQGFNAPLETFR